MGHAAAKKRKVEEVATKPTAAVTSKPVSANAAAGPSKAPTPKDKSKVSADMSFFGAAPPTTPAYKPRSKFPEIKKHEATACQSTTPAGAIASSAPSLLAATMATLRQSYDPVPSQPTTVPRIATAEVAEVKSAVKKPNKKGHVVQFVDNVPQGRELVSVRMFELPAHESELPWWFNTEVSITHQLWKTQTDDNVF